MIQLMNSGTRRIGPSWYTSTFWSSDSLASMQYSLLTVLQVVHSERLDSSKAVSALAREHRGRYRRVLMRLSERLGKGLSVVDALEQTPDALSDHAVLGLRLASQTGALSQMYEQLMRSEAPRIDDSIRDFRNERVYWSFVALTSFVILLFLMYFIVPTFKKMMEEFGMALPRPLILLMTAWDFFGSNLLSVIAITLMFMWLMWSSYSKRFYRQKISPMISRNASRMHSIQLFQLFAVAVDAGRPLASCVSTLARYHFDRSIRQRLLFSRNEMEQGVGEWESLLDSGLVQREECRALLVLPSNHARAWFLQRLANRKLNEVRQRSSYWVIVAQPVFILLLAAMVLWISYSFLGVLSQMTLELAGANR